MLENSATNYRVIWEPLRGAQTHGLTCPCDEILMEGTRGPGKTDVQLFKFRRYVGLGYGHFWRGVIFDREYKNLDDLVSKSLRWFPQFDDGARFHSAKADYKWVWPTGEELLFRKIKKLSDYWNYHGQEYPFIGWNELTKFPTSELYEMLKSCNRSSFLPREGDNLPHVPLIIFSTTNPYGPGHNWVKREWIDPAPPGVIMRKKVNVFNPRSGKREDIIKTKVRIFCSYKENKYLSPNYVAELESIKEPNKRKAWLHGDWDITAGGALDDLWGSHVLIPRFRIPASWRIFRSMDWGSSHPFSIGWWAEATGEEVKLPYLKTWAPPPGSLIRFYEWYGTDAIGTNKGLQTSSIDVAKGIVSIERKLKSAGWIGAEVQPGPADNQIRDIKDRASESIAKQMEAYGVSWLNSDKSAGSRKIGLQLIRDRMENSKRREGPGLYFTMNCKAAISTLPVLPRDEDNLDDVDTDAEDHVYDDVRYACLHLTRYPSNIDISHAR